MDQVWRSLDTQKIIQVGNELEKAWQEKRNVFICGNGGSAANANDLIFGISSNAKAMKVHSLCANSSIMTCLANDVGYENVFSHQLKTLGTKGDILIVLSGSGNSLNILNALKEPNKLGLKSIALVGYDEGKSKQHADISIHIKVDDMQVAEDFQMIIFHALMTSLKIYE